MLKQLWTACLSTAALFALAATLFLTATPQAVASSAPAFDTRYSAGNETSGTHICNCPVTVGNCVCAYTDPPAPKEAEEIAQ
ncbi:MAG: hypothetical protein WAV20_08885 [Blastocatellia bacterium]